MRALVQRVSSASVEIAGDIAGNIGKGILVFVAVTHDDTEKDIKFLADKCVNLRIFDDKDGKMNLSVLDVKGDVLVVSQFTLYGDASHGRRPSFTSSAHPAHAVPLYDLFIRKSGLKIETGRFRTEMDVKLCNHGPVTIFIDSKSK